MTHEQQIKAVAEALDPYLDMHVIETGKAGLAAQAAIAAMGEVNAQISHSSAPCVKGDNLASPAMQVREMTVEEVAANLELVIPSWGTSKLYAKALAKLGTIKIVEKANG